MEIKNIQILKMNLRKISMRTNSGTNWQVELIIFEYKKKNLKTKMTSGIFFYLFFYRILVITPAKFFSNQLDFKILTDGI